jgi:hypothetical protein
LSDCRTLEVLTRILAWNSNRNAGLEFWEPNKNGTKIQINRPFQVQVALPIWEEGIQGSLALMSVHLRTNEKPDIFLKSNSPMVNVLGAFAKEHTMMQACNYGDSH